MAGLAVRFDTSAVRPFSVNKSQSYQVSAIFGAVLRTIKICSINGRNNEAKIIEMRE
jgi:hypothetical protein